MSAAIPTQRRRDAGSGTWPRVRLGEVCEIVLGGTPSTHNASFWGGGIPWLTPGEMRKLTSRYVEHTERTLTEAGLAAGSRLCPARSVVLSTRAPIGYVFINTVSMATNQGCKTLVPSAALSPEYLYYNLLGRTDELNALGTGTTFKELATGDLKKLLIPLPPLAIQRRIAAKLDLLCDIVAKRKNQLAQLNQLVKSRFVEMFGDGQYPEQPLYKLSEITGGLTKNGKRKSMPLKYKYLRVANVFYNRLDLSDVHEIGVEEAEIPKTLLKKNDLLFVEGNGSIEQVGRVALWNGEINPCLHQNHLIKVRFNSGVAPEYVLFYFMSEAGRHQIKESAVSTTGLHTLSTGKVANLRLPLPPLALQREFAAFVEKVDKLAFAVRKSLESAEKLYRQQLSEAFA